MRTEEAAVTPSTAWDNEVTISTNQAAGTFSTTITIPNLEKGLLFPGGGIQWRWHGGKP